MVDTTHNNIDNYFKLLTVIILWNKINSYTEHSIFLPNYPSFISKNIFKENIWISIKLLEWVQQEYRYYLHNEIDYMNNEIENMIKIEWFFEFCWF